MTLESFLTPGSFTWTVPAGVTSVDVSVRGGGAYGVNGMRINCASNDKTSYSGGGGGQGGLAFYNNLAVVPGEQYIVTIGVLALNPFSNFTNGGAGQNCSFVRVASGVNVLGGGAAQVTSGDNTAGVTSCPQGFGSSLVIAGGIGGSASGGTTNTSGANGTAGTRVHSTSTQPNITTFGLGGGSANEGKGGDGGKANIGDTNIQSAPETGYVKLEYTIVLGFPGGPRTRSRAVTDGRKRIASVDFSTEQTGKHGQSSVE